MTLSVTGPSIFLGQDLVGGKGIEFIPTDMDAVDGNGQPMGKKLHIARTPLINAHRGAINGHLFRQGYTHGSMALYADGTAYVIGRDIRTESDEIKRKLRAPVMEAHHVDATVVSIKHDIRFVPDGSLVLADPEFATHPAVNMTWYEGASQAAALEDAVQKQFPGMRIRMIRDQEYTRLVTWDGKYTKQEVVARAHLCKDASECEDDNEYNELDVTATAYVLDEAAKFRTTEEGFVDVLGNVDIWTDSINNRRGADLTGTSIDKWGRFVRGVPYFLRRSTALVDTRYGLAPFVFDEFHGVRFVAVPG